MKLQERYIRFENKFTFILLIEKMTKAKIVYLYKLYNFVAKKTFSFGLIYCFKIQFEICPCQLLKTFAKIFALYRKKHSTKKLFV